MYITILAETHAKDTYIYIYKCGHVYVCVIEIVLLWISPDFTNNLTYSKSNLCCKLFHCIYTYYIIL